MKPTRSRKPRTRSLNLSGAPEEHRLRVPALLDYADRETLDAEASARAGDCGRAVRALAQGRELIGAAAAHAGSSRDSEAAASVMKAREEWERSASQINQRCVRARPAPERPRGKRT